MIKLVNLLDENASGDCSVDAPHAEELVGSGTKVDDGARCVFGCEMGLFNDLLWLELCRCAVTRRIYYLDVVPVSA
jgi:hypothetical protein